jgi:hypothetical protein
MAQYFGYKERPGLRPSGAKSLSMEIRMKKVIFIICTFISSCFLFCESPFAFVMYDAQSEMIIGKFPPERDVYANLVLKLKENEAKAIVFKYFFDLPKNTIKDQVFADSLKELPVFLQARIDNSEKKPNDLLNKYYSSDLLKSKNVITGNSGWIPISTISFNAYDLGFVDIRNPSYIPLFEKYKGHYVKSLWYSIIKYIFPDVKIENGSLINGNRKINSNDFGEVKIEYPLNDSLQYISFSNLINEHIDSKIFQNKIVIVGYDGNNIDSIQTPIGSIKSHRVFIYGLLSLYDQLK